MQAVYSPLATPRYRCETLRHIQSNSDPASLSVDSPIGTLRDRSVSWFVDAWRDISNTELVREVRLVPSRSRCSRLVCFQAFARCIVRSGLNLSFESIASSAALKLVRELPGTDPALWPNIVADYGVEDSAGNGDSSSTSSESEDEYESEGEEDDTAVLPAVLMESLARGRTRHSGTDSGLSEDLDANTEEHADTVEEECGRGKRRKTFDSRYRDFEYKGDSWYLCTAFINTCIPFHASNHMSLVSCSRPIVTRD